MSLFGGIKKIFKKVAGPVASMIPGVGSIVGPMVSGALDPAYQTTGKKAMREYQRMMGSMPGMGFTSFPGQSAGLPGPWRPPMRLPIPSAGAAGALGGMAADFLSGLNFGGVPESKTLADGRVRYARRRADGSLYYPRRMNPLNPRAARRAIRRIKAVRRITRDIERSLPKVTTRRRAA